MPAVTAHDLPAVLDHISSAIILLDPAGDIQYVNPTTCRLLDQPATNLLGHAFAAQFYGRDLANLAQSDLWETTGPQQRYTVWASALYDPAAQRTGTLVQLTANVIGWSASALLNTLLSESLSPLSACQGYVELLLRNAAGPLTEPQQQLLTALRVQVERVLAVRREVLEQAKIHVRQQDDPPQAAV